MITKLFYVDLSEKMFCQKICHQVVEAEAIQKLRFHIPELKRNLSSAIEILLHSAYKLTEFFAI